MEAYVRLGNESVKADATELKRLVLRGKNSSYDALGTTYSVSDYAFSKLRERYKAWTGESLEDKELVSFGLVDDKGKLTNAGALLADNSPIRWSRVFCTRWNGLDKGGGIMDALDDAEYSGSLISLLNEGTAFIKRNMKTMWKKTANSRIDMPEYCERSCFEALVNALVHRLWKAFHKRCYLNMGAVYVKHYTDRIVIENPGAFPEGVNEKNIITHPSMPRNKLIAETVQRLKYVQRTEQGVDIIFREMISSGKPYPQYRVYNEAVSLTIFSAIDDVNFVKFIAREQDKLQKILHLPELMILRYLTENKRVILSEVQELTQLPIAEARKSCNNLVQDGLIGLSGKEYMLTAKVYDAIKSDVEYTQDCDSICKSQKFDRGILAICRIYNE